MDTVNQFLQSKLAAREQAGAYRELRTSGTLVDFCSNDYLGFARSAKLKQLIEAEIQSHPDTLNGSTGSRLLAGNTKYTTELEQSLAQQFQSEAALLYNSGYDANVGLLSCLPQRGDTVLHDELIHASIIDGIRLSNAARYSFRHNDIQHLEEKLKRSTGHCFVIVESIYSMDGDEAPLSAIAAICIRYNASLIVDEAHATGLFGHGLVLQHHMQENVFARIVTFGKALGCHGAMVLGSQLLINYLINFSRSFIYTTAAPFHQLATIKAATFLLSESAGAMACLRNNIILFKQQLRADTGIQLIESDSAIQCLVIGGNDKARHAATLLQKAGYDVRAILAPTVPAGTERLRICLHTYNTPAQITGITTTLKQILHE